MLKKIPCNTDSRYPDSPESWLMQRHVRLGGQFEPFPIRCIRCFMGLHHPLVGQPVKRKSNVSVQEVGFSMALYCLSIFNSFSCNKSHPAFNKKLDMGMRQKRQKWQKPLCWWHGPTNYLDIPISWTNMWVSNSLNLWDEHPNLLYDMF